MSLFEMFVNKDPLRRQRDRAKDFAREAYNPDVFNEAINIAREQGVEGISQGVEDLSRSRTLQSLFRERDMGLYGGNVGAAIAGAQAGDTAARTAMAGFEADMAIADEQARQAGRQQYGQLATQQGQVLSQQKAAMEEADLMYQAEVDARTQKIKGTALQLGLMAATLPFGGGGSLLSRGLGALASGGVGKVATDLAGETVASGVDAVGSTIDSFTDMGTFADQLASIPQQPPTPIEIPKMETAGVVPYAKEREPMKSPFGADQSIPDVVPSTQQLPQQEAPMVDTSLDLEPEELTEMFRQSALGVEQPTYQQALDVNMPLPYKKPKNIYDKIEFLFNILN